jgi:uncharacterized protein (TIGR02145 family)
MNDFFRIRSFNHLFVIAAIIIIGCNKEDEEKNPDPDAFTLNGVEFKPTEFSAIRSLNQLVIISQNDRATARLVFFRNDTGIFEVKPNSLYLRKGEAAAQLSVDGKVYFGKSGTITIHKSGETYSGEYNFNAELDGSKIDLKNGKFKDVAPASINYGTVVDKEGNSYKTVQIGSQTWMAQNFRSTLYADGTPIAGVRSYNDNDTLTETYGRLYTWNDAMHGNTVEMSQGVCPDGWHVPSEAEVNTLLETAGGNQKAGNKLKASVSWLDYYHNNERINEDCILNNNSLGFSAVAAGSYTGDYYEYRGIYGSFWNSTSPLPGVHGYVVFDYSSGFVTVYSFRSENRAFPVRCLKNN